MHGNFVEDFLEQGRIFVNEIFVDVNFVPDHLLHRDQELRDLTAHNISLVNAPFTISKNLLLVGPTGIGTTTLARYFANTFSKAAKTHHVTIRPAYINCNVYPTAYQVVIALAGELDPGVSRRGLGITEQILRLGALANARNTYFLMILDGIDRMPPDEVKTLLELPTVDPRDGFKCISSICTARDEKCRSQYSLLRENTIHLARHTREQVYDILQDRKLAFRPGVIKDDVLELIARDVDARGGNLRYGFDLLHRAGKHAENRGHQEVLAEDVLMVKQLSMASAMKDNVATLNFGQKLVLLALDKIIEASEHHRADFQEICTQYISLCKNIHQPPRQSTQVREVLKTLETREIVYSVVEAVVPRGRKAFFYLLAPLPAELFDDNDGQNSPGRNKGEEDY